MSPSPTLLVFAKAPQPGQVKTRLLPVLKAEAAARLHRALVCHTLASARAVPGVLLYLYCAPDTQHPFFRHCATTFGVQLRPQQGADLGERMGQALQQALTMTRAALLVGCDCPELEPNLLHQACTALDHHEAVLGPALDGGYVLIGLTRYLPELFQNMPWGSDQVLALTRTRLRQAGFRWYELPFLRDLDRPEDLLHYPHLDPRLNLIQGGTP